LGYDNRDNLNPIPNDGYYREWSYDKKTTIGVILPSICAGERYDSRSHFCDFSIYPNVRKPFCGPKQEKYRTGSPWAEECTDDVTPAINATVGQVTIPCGAGRIPKATQFCMTPSSNPRATPRCGVRNTVTGQYSSGKVNSKRVDALTGALLYSGDGNFEYYAPGNESTIPAANPINAQQINGALFLGEFSDADQEFCIRDRVVKVCGPYSGTPRDDQYFDERWQFCAFGNKIAPHCDDRVIYDPDVKFCSFVGNSMYNIPKYIGTGDYYNQLLSGNDCIDTDGSVRAQCKQYASTALTFCNVGGTKVRYNVDTISVDVTPEGVSTQTHIGKWMWDYCIEPTVGSFSVLRCAKNQEPADTSLIGPGFPPIDVQERARCTCIPHAKPLTMGENGCECGSGFRYSEVYATGLTKSEAATPVSRLSGGRCEIITYDAVVTNPNAAGYNCYDGISWNKDPKRIKENGTCCDAGEEAIYASGTCAVPAVDCSGLIGDDNHTYSNIAEVPSGVKAWKQIRNSINGTSCILKKPATTRDNAIPSGKIYCKTPVKQYNEVEYCSVSEAMP